MNDRRSRIQRTPPETAPAHDSARAVSRRDLLASIGSGAVAGSLLAGAASPSPAEASGEDDRAANALEFAGKLIQEGGRFTGFGFLTAVRGIDPALLFDGAGAPSEGTALLTIYTVSTLTSIARVNGVFVARAAGTLRLYLRDAPGADFGDPSSFEVGTLVADDEAEYQNTLTVTEPNQGLAHIVGALKRRRAVRFLVGGDHHRIGSKGLASRLTAVGKGVRTDPSTPLATFDLGGYITIVD